MSSTETGPTRPKRGLTLFEIAMAMTIFTVGGLGILSVARSNLELAAVNAETAIATEAARREIERLRAVPFAELLAAAASKRTGFEVSELAAEEDVTDAAGGVVLPVDESGRLREIADFPELGFPRDLNGDGTIDEENHAGDCLVLPVLVRVTWCGAGGANRVELGTILRQGGPR